jgi:hypothetical protein
VDEGLREVDLQDYERGGSPAAGERTTVASGGDASSSIGLLDESFVFRDFHRG